MCDQCKRKSCEADSAVNHMLMQCKQQEENSAGAYSEIIVDKNKLT
jgi:hypothetical protein